MTESDFNVLMIGPRRAGKSSVLSAMLRSLEHNQEKGGFQFVPTADTRKAMDRKLTDLEKLYVLHANQPDQPFSTILGQEGDVQYSEFTSGAIQYEFDFFALNRWSRKNEKVSHRVTFTDISGEQMLDDLKQQGNGVVDRFMKSNVIIVAVDSPALMEGRVRDDVGEFHRFANIPDSVYDVISVSDATMREHLKEGQKIMPKMVLFVPLKCEKYYHEGTMDELKQRVKAGYRDSLAFLAARNEYTVAITPIQTLGDIVFDHYDTRVNERGKEVVKRFQGDVRGIAHMPNALYRLRDSRCTSINPRFCEQPLLYLEGYMMGLDRYLEKAKKKADTARKGRTPLGKAINIAKTALWIYLFGAFYFIYKGADAILRDESLMNAIKGMVGKIKTSGDGYEVVQDNLGIVGLKNAYRSAP